MKFFVILPALLLSFSALASDPKTCTGAACAEKAHACDTKTCKEGCDGTQCEKHGCKDKACALKTKNKATAPTSGTTTAAPATTTSTTGSTNYQVTMEKDQMHCGDCAKKVSAALKGLPDVDQGSVKVLLSKNTATLQVAPNSKVTAEQIKKTIEEKTGYTVSKVETLTK